MRTILSGVILCLFFASPILAAKARTTAFAPFLGEVPGIVTKELELRFVSLMGRAFAKFGVGRIILPDEFSRILVKKSFLVKSIYSKAEYESLAAPVDHGGIISVVLQPARTGVEIHLTYFDYSTGVARSVSFTTTAADADFAMVKQILQMEADRILLGRITPKTRIMLHTAFDDETKLEWNRVLKKRGYQVSINSPANVTDDDIEAFRFFESKGISYAAPTVSAEEGAPQFSELAAPLLTLAAKRRAHILLVIKQAGPQTFVRALEIKTGRVVWQQDAFPAADSGTIGDQIEIIVDEMEREPIEIQADQWRINLAEDLSGVALKGGGLARVAILDFYDKTNTALYGYLSSSLGNAINESMQRIFEYERADAGLSATVGKQYLSNEVVGENALKNFQKGTGSDYLIFGEYVLDKHTQRITIRAKVYDLGKLLLVGDVQIESRVDASLFSSVDKIATQIVQNILLMAQKK